MRALASLLVLAACWTDASPLPPPPPVLHPASPLVPSLEALPPAMTMAARAKFRLRWRVTNDGRETLDTKLAGSSNLLVNGAPSNQWRASVGNGAVDPEWDALRPGKTITREYDIGEELFPAPGDYTLVLVLEHATSRPLRVHVGP